MITVIILKGEIYDGQIEKNSLEISVYSLHYYEIASEN